MKELTLKPIRSIAGEVTLPGSKSLSNRALLLSALAEGTTSLNNLLSAGLTEEALLGAVPVTTEFGLLPSTGFLQLKAYF